MKEEHIFRALSRCLIREADEANTAHQRRWFSVCRSEIHWLASSILVSCSRIVRSRLQVYSGQCPVLTLHDNEIENVI